MISPDRWSTLLYDNTHGAVYLACDLIPDWECRGEPFPQYSGALYLLVFFAIPGDLPGTVFKRRKKRN